MQASSKSTLYVDVSLAHRKNPNLDCYDAWIHERLMISTDVGKMQASQGSEKRLFHNMVSDQSLSLYKCPMHLNCNVGHQYSKASSN